MWRMPPGVSRVVSDAEVALSGQRRVVGAFVVSALMVLLLTNTNPMPGTYGLTVIPRGLLAGLVAGLLFTDGELWIPALCGAGGALVGLLGLAAGGAIATVPQMLGTISGAALTAVGASFAARERLHRIIAALGLCAIAVMFLWQAGVLPGPYRPVARAWAESRLVDAPAETQAFDGQIYLKTLHLVEKGEPFYDAFATAFEADRRNGGPPASALGYRQPWPWLLWSVLPGSGGPAVRAWFVATVLIGLLCAYLTARRYLQPSAALLAPALVAAYFTPMTYSTWLFVPDLWAGIIAIALLWALSRKRWVAAALLLTLAVAFREIAAIFTVAYLAAWLINARRREELAGLSIALLGPAVVLAMHVQLAPAISGTFDISPWLHGGFTRMLSALRFNGEFMAFGSATLVVMPVLSIVGAAFARPAWRRNALLAFLLVPLAFLTVFSAGEWGAYWLSIIQPAMLTLAPLALIPLLPTAELLFAPARSKPGMVRVVLPAYNEEKSIGDLLDRIIAVMEAQKQAYAVLVVDDGSSDATAAQAKTRSDRAPVTVVTNKRNLGLGGAIARGLKAAAFASGDDDVIVTLDADLTQEPENIPDLIAAYRRGADLVIASRYRPGSKVIGLSRFRHFLTMGARAVMGTFMSVEGVRDYSCGFRLYSGPLLRRAFEGLGDGFVTQRGFACMVEILGRLRRVAVVDEVPFVLHYEAKRQASAMNIGRTVRSYWSVLRDVNVDEWLGRTCE